MTLLLPQKLKKRGYFSNFYKRFTIMYIQNIYINPMSFALTNLASLGKKTIQFKIVNIIVYGE